MKKILITGGSGFVGSYLIDAARQKFEVHATHHNHEIIQKNIFSHSLNMAKTNEAERIIDRIKPDVIIHTAAYSDLDFCESNRLAAKTVNHDFTAAMCRAAQKKNIRFIFTSTDMVFDGKSGNYTEQDQVNPCNFYGETKVMAEHSLASMKKNVVIARIALVYGFSLTINGNFFGDMVRLITTGKSVTLFDDQHRSPISVYNLTTALLELAENDFSGIIHLSGCERINRWDFGLKTCSIFGLLDKNVTKGSMFDISPAAVRPQDISMKNNLARRILKTELLNCDQGILQVKRGGKD